MRIGIEDSTQTVNTVVTVDFKGSIDFTLDTEGNVIGGENTMTHQELYDAIKPLPEVVEYEQDTEYADGVDLEGQE